MVKHLTNPLAGRPIPLGTLLSTAGRRLAAELDAGLAAAGYGDLRSAHAPLFMTIEPDGSSVTQLAERARMTKQATSELVRYLEACGYVELAVNDTDRRARKVTLTARGWQALDVGLSVIDNFEHWLNDTVGAAHVEAIRATLDRILTTESTAWRPLDASHAGDRRSNVSTDAHRGAPMARKSGQA